MYDNLIRFEQWALVGAGVKDMSRPADKLSLSQSLGMYLHFAS